LTGSTKQKELGKESIEKILVPIPPLAEQKRIVDKLDRIMPLIDEYAKSYTHLAEIDSSFNDRMKKSILQYAMEGKLVSQDPDDEPASELLKKIQQEKTQLV
ncbi:type I restriction endonuclease, partial [Lactobacillus delbrueckii subsp. bulgaricus]|nr:type I restriction endonuclease [Lactobacillus delbrueckii subsp. bulgaricus]